MQERVFFPGLRKSDRGLSNEDYRYFQKEIINIIKNKKVFKDILPYLQKLSQLDFGKYYIYNLVDYLIENEYLLYFEKYQGEEFLKRMTL